MSDDPLVQPMQAESATVPKLQLRVVLDTNVLHTDSASALVRREVSTLLEGNIHPDLEIVWYLPDVVRHERRYQMRKKAIELHSSMKKIEQLLVPSLSTTKEMFLGRVDEKIEHECKRLGLQDLPVDTTAVDWSRMISDSLYRQLPFQEGETEKGFRDALIAESFIQLVSKSPQAPDECRVVLITSDKRLARTVKSRLSDSSIATVYSGFEELKGFINTLIANVDEEFIARLQLKAKALFFGSSQDNIGVYYSESVHKRLIDRFGEDLTSAPNELTYRLNGQWWINEPQFVRKETERIVWATRLDVEVSARRFEVEHWRDVIDSSASPIQPLTLGDLFSIEGLSKGGWSKYQPIKTIITHKGTDSYEIVWSTVVTISEELAKPVIEEIKHIGVNWEAVTS